MWSDGVTVWVVDDTDDKLYAYELATGARRRGLEFDTLIGAGNRSAKGLWSDGSTMWVADDVDDRLYSYNMPPSAMLRSLELSGFESGSRSGACSTRSGCRARPHPRRSPPPPRPPARR